MDKDKDKPVAKLVTVTWSKTVTMPVSFDPDDAGHTAVASGMAWVELQPQDYAITQIKDTP